MGATITIGIRGARRRETEIKLAVEAPAALLKQLKRLGFYRSGEREFERNEIFDFPDGWMRRSERLLRLRLAGDSYTLTYKGAPRASEHYKIRQEIECHTGEADELRRILEAIGLEIVFRYEKFRTTYLPAANRRDKDRGLLVLDETPIGTYVELEGPTAWIDRVARRLGYGRDDYITESYAGLFARRRKARRLACRDMVFMRRIS